MQHKLRKGNNNINRTINEQQMKEKRNLKELSTEQENELNTKLKRDGKGEQEHNTKRSGQIVKEKGKYKEQKKNNK